MSGHACPSFKGQASVVQDASNEEKEVDIRMEIGLDTSNGGFLDVQTSPKTKSASVLAISADELMEVADSDEDTECFVRDPEARMSEGYDGQFSVCHQNV